MLAYLDCFSGISGDMLLGALLDAGLDLDALRAGLATLPLEGYTLEAERVSDHGISGTRALVRLDTAAPHAHRHLADIAALLVAGALPERASERALAIFRRLAAAEAVIHGSRPEEVTFHEVGAVDSIVDIVGTALGFELLGVEALYCSALPLTSGRVHAAHGALPVPAPATLELLKDSGAVWQTVPAEGELVTPTGAAVLATLARFERPAAVAVRRVGYGFGQRSLPWANCLRLVLGEAAQPQPTVEEPFGQGFERDEIAVLESNIDTMTGEALGWLMERLLAAGAARRELYTAADEEAAPRHAAQCAGAGRGCRAAGGDHPARERDLGRAPGVDAAAQGGPARGADRDAARLGARQAEADRRRARRRRTRIRGLPRALGAAGSAAGDGDGAGDAGRVGALRAG
jgi:uncharacterized protein (TIGR00299 family) protein